MSEEMSRRTFLGCAVAAGAADVLSLSFLRPAQGTDSPLAHYPRRGWERLYRDVYAFDDSYVFMCTPNCTHNCYLRAYVKNGVVTRCGPTQRYHEGTDVYGTRASQRWDPRHCNKGLAIVRRFNGDRRVKSPMVRRGFLEWVESGFPRDADGLPHEWILRMMNSIASLAWRFSAHRMVMDYTVASYLPAAGGLSRAMPGNS